MNPTEDNAQSPFTKSILHEINRHLEDAVSHTTLSDSKSRRLLDELLQSMTISVKAKHAKTSVTEPKKEEAAVSNNLNPKPAVQTIGVFSHMSHGFSTHHPLDRPSPFGPGTRRQELQELVKVVNLFLETSDQCYQPEQLAGYDFWIGDFGISRVLNRRHRTTA